MPMMRETTVALMQAARNPGGKRDVARPLPRPTRVLCEGAGSFTVHGHRLSSLYRAWSRAPFPFIVLKILIFSRLQQAAGFEYFWNSEAQGRRG